jgi:5'-3' exonuclease
MGIKNFSKVFNHNGAIKIKDLSGKTIAIDVMHKLYQAALGAKSVSTLTDSEGRPTIHINVILSNILEFKRNNVNQIWVFDYQYDPNDKEFHNPIKLEEIEKRRKKRKDAEEKLKKIAESKVNENSTTITEDSGATQAFSDDIDQLEKMSFRPTKETIDDIKLILDYLNIKYIESPFGYEGESIATYLNMKGDVDAVYSGDTDPIAYGAKTLLRVNPRDKKIYEYTQDSIIKQLDDKHKLESKRTISDIRKVAVIMGTDFCNKTPKIGPKTVLTKLDSIKLTEQQKDAIGEYQKLETADIKLVIKNKDKTAFSDSNDKLIDWLVNKKGFNRERLQKLFTKEAPISRVRRSNSKSEIGKSDKSKNTKVKKISKNTELLLKSLQEE